MGYGLGIDVGATSTAMCVGRAGRTRVTVLPGDGPLEEPAAAGLLLHSALQALLASEGAPPDRTVLTCPAIWDVDHRSRLALAAQDAGLPAVSLVSAQESVVAHLVRAGRLGEDDVVVVYDVAAPTVDLTVVRVNAGLPEILGLPEGVDLPAGDDVAGPAPAGLLGTLPALRRTLASAGLEPGHLSAVVLVGDPAWYPVAGDVLIEHLGRPLLVDERLEHWAAQGAALLADGSVGVGAGADAGGGAGTHAGAPGGPPPVGERRARRMLDRIRAAPGRLARRKLLSTAVLTLSLLALGAYLFAGPTELILRGPAPNAPAAVPDRARAARAEPGRTTTAEVTGSGGPVTPAGPTTPAGAEPTSSGPPAPTASRGPGPGRGSVLAAGPARPGLTAGSSGWSTTRPGGPAARPGPPVEAVSGPTPEPPRATPTPGLATGTGRLVSSGGRCLDRKDGLTSPGTPVRTFGCNGTGAQVWTAAADGTLRSAGRCLRVADASEATSRLDVGDCTGAPDQVWRVTSRAVVQPSSGRCLDVLRATGETQDPAVVTTCTGDEAQTWRLSS